MNQREIENLIGSMTVSVFASLPTAWPEYVIYGGKLIARISPNCNRPGGDDDGVLARVLVYMPDDDDEIDRAGLHGLHGLRRLTIREKNLELNPQDISDYLAGSADRHMLPHWQEVRENYWRCLHEILTMPVVDLSNPWRNLQTA